MLVGTSAASERFRLKAPTRPEGLVIRGFARGVAILGEVVPKGTIAVKAMDRGTLNGVYEFLERYLGIRMLFRQPLGRVIPRKRRLAVPDDLNFASAPEFNLRMMRGRWNAVARGGSALGFWADHTHTHRLGQALQENAPRSTSRRKRTARATGASCATPSRACRRPS